MSTLKIFGLVLIGLGLLGFAMPFFTTHENKEIASVGDVKLQANEEETYTIPPVLAGGVLIVGVILVGAGLFKRA